MSFKIRHKISVIVAIPALLSLALSAYGLCEARLERQRFAQVEDLSAIGLTTHRLIEAVEAVVIAADAVIIETDQSVAKTKILTLRQRIIQLETIESIFFDKLDTRLSTERKTQIALRLTDFKSYQNDTAELGLTISPRAAQIQADDPSTITNREETIQALNRIATEVFAVSQKDLVAIAALQSEADAAMIMIPCGTILAGLVLAAFVARRQISEPLSSLGDCMAQLANGALDAVVPHASKGDEIGQMAVAIEVFRDAMIANKQGLTTSVARSHAETQRANLILDASRTFESDAMSMMEDLGASVGAMDLAAHDVAMSSEGTLSQAHTVWKAAEDATAILMSVSIAADDLSRGATDISKRVGAAHAAAAGALVEAHIGAEKVGSLIATAGSIGGSAHLIEDIARQTNLLALNATIEAARAGDMGRGFAVVAGEVKSLAHRTAEATAIIRNHVAMIQNTSSESAKSIMAMRVTLDQMNIIAAEVADASMAQGRSSVAIAEALSRATEQAKIVSSSIGQVNGSAIANGSRARDLKAKAGHHGVRAKALGNFIAAFVEDMRRNA